jgi:hypothetical protein
VTQHIDAGILAEAAERAIGIESSRELALSLRAGGLELVTVTEVAVASLLPTYRIRLERWKSGEGPHCVGLDHFVQTLAMQSGRLSMFVWNDESSSFVGLLDASGSLLVDATAVHRQGTEGLL